jgi:hypothetical protein
MTCRFLLAFCLLAASALSTQAQERQWMLDASDSDAYLIFGVPDSDDVGISFWCPVQQGEVNVFIPEASAKLHPGADITVTLKADAESATFTGKSEVNLEAALTSVEAKVPANAQILAAMLKADRFRVIIEGNETIFPLIDADLESLLDLCRKP